MCTLQHTSCDEQGPLCVCWIHKAMGTCKSHLRLQKTNVSIPVHRSSSEGRGGWSCSDPGAPGRALPEWPRAGGTAQVEAAAQVLPQLCSLLTKIWLCMLCPAGGIVGLSFGCSPGDPAGVPGDSGAPQGGIPFSCVFFPKFSVIFSMLGETGSSLSTTLLHWGHSGRVLCFSGRCFLTSFASDGASSSIGHELHKMGITTTFTGLKTIQGLRKDLLSQPTDAVGVTSPIPCFLWRSCFNQGW